MLINTTTIHGCIHGPMTLQLSVDASMGLQTTVCRERHLCLTWLWKGIEGIGIAGSVLCSVWVSVHTREEKGREMRLWCAVISLLCCSLVLALSCRNACMQGSSVLACLVWCTSTFCKAECSVLVLQARMFSSSACQKRTLNLSANKFYHCVMTGCV